jgi:hypothetical protein
VEEAESSEKALRRPNNKQAGEKLELQVQRPESRTRHDIIAGLSNNMMGGEDRREKVSV